MREGAFVLVPQLLTFGEGKGLHFDIESPNIQDQPTLFALWIFLAIKASIR